MKRAFHSRGSALLTAMMVVAVILLVVASMLYYTNQEKGRAITLSRSFPRNYCVDTGLQYARSYFGKNQPLWSTYLSDTAHLNPVASSFCNPAATAATPATSGYSWQYLDLDGDGNNDVYIYIRDNEDELPPASNNCHKAGDTCCKNDNDLQVIVGAVCISTTIAPRRQDGTLDTSLLTAEALVQYNANGCQYAQRGTCPDGNDNHNR